MRHKFINKKTGAEARVMAIYLDSDGVMQVDGYDTVEDLMDNYAAYEEYNPPAEPLIKDEKIRKAVRAWAEANGVFEVQFGYDDGGNWSLSDTTHEEWICIEFKSDLPLSLNGCRRTVKELCGEEEE